MFWHRRGALEFRRFDEVRRDLGLELRRGDVLAAAAPGSAVLNCWVFEPSDAGDSTVHASFMLNSYHEPGEMTAAEAAETLETLVRWSE